MSVTDNLRCFRCTCYYVIMLHNTTTWFGKEVTNSSYRAVKCKRLVHVLMYEVQERERKKGKQKERKKYKTTAFTVTRFM